MKFLVESKYFIDGKKIDSTILKIVHTTIDM